MPRCVELFKALEIALAVSLWRSDVLCVKSTPTTSPTMCVYDGDSFQGSNILPKGLTNQISTLSTIYSYCIEGDNIDWKYGVTDGLQTSTDEEIDYNLLFCHEGFYIQGYIPLDSSTGLPYGTSGVTIGVGVDLGHQSYASLSAIGIDTALLDQFNDYFGLTTTDAASALCENGPLSIDSSDAYSLSVTVIEQLYVSSVKTKFNQDTSKYTWDELTKGIKTVILSMYYINGDKLFGWNFWSQIISASYDEAIINLRTWESSSGFFPKSRYDDLANILEASIACESDVDIVFLIDGSGSVSTDDFTSGLNFIVSIIENFQIDDVTSGVVRFGVAQFSTSYGDHFYMNTYLDSDSTSVSSDLTDAVQSISKFGGSTYLASAMESLASNQFSETNGMRADSLYVARVAIILTDGVSHDGVSNTGLNSKGADIIAIGIGGYSEDQLNDIGDQVYFIDDYDQLTSILSNVRSGSCYASATISTNDGESDVITASQLSTNYYETQITGNAIKNTQNNRRASARRLLNSNNGYADGLTIDIEQNSGCVYVYLSFCNLFPSYSTNQFSHTSCSESSKQITIGYQDVLTSILNCSNSKNNTQWEINNDTIFALHIAIEGIDVLNNYTIELSDCYANSSDCKTGTNSDTMNDGADSILIEYACEPEVSDSASALNISVNASHCFEKETERDCVGYYGLCLWAEIDIKELLTTTTLTQTSQDSQDATEDHATRTVVSFLSFAVVICWCLFVL